MEQCSVDVHMTRQRCSAGDEGEGGRVRVTPRTSNNNNDTNY